MIGSTQFDNIVAPTRTKSDMEEFGHLLSFEEDSVHSDVTRTTYMVETEPEKTTSEFDHDTSHISTTTDSDFPPTTEKLDDYAEKTNEDKDDAEDGIFYSYDYDSKEKNVTKGKSGNGPVRKFDDKSKNQQTTETDVQDDDTRINDVPRAQDPINQEYPEIPNMATKVDFTSSINHSTSPKIYGVQKTLKDILRDKRHQVCSMVKLGNLNFDTPKTLPEVNLALMFYYFRFMYLLHMVR